MSRSLFAAAGALALGVQVYELREYLVVLQGDELGVGLGLGAWLVGIALGAGVARRASASSAPRRATQLLVVLALSGYGGVAGIRVARWVAHAPSGELLALGPALAIALAAFAMPGAVVGALFVTLASAAARHAGAAAAIGRLYVFEAVGSLIAGVAVSLVLVPWLPPLAGYGLLAAASLAGAFPAARTGFIGGRWWIAGAFAALLGASTSPIGAALEQKTERLRFESLVPTAATTPLLRSVETPYQYATLTGGDAHALYSDGQYVTSFPDASDDEARAHLLMVLSERPARVLALGRIYTGMLAFCLRHPVVRLDLVEIDQRAFELVRAALPPEDRGALGDPRVRVIIDDPRRFLASPGDRYDLVIALSSDPVTLLTARETTREFARLVRNRLARAGIYVSRFSAGANVQTGETALTGATLYRTLNDVFPVVRAAAGPDGLFVAGLDPDRVSVDPERLAERYRARAIQSDVFAPELFAELVPSERGAALQGELERWARTSRISTDDRPVSFLHALAVRQQTARSAGAPLLGATARHPGALAVLGLAPSLLLALWRVFRRSAPARSVAALHATLVAGAAGMAQSLMLFFSFQTRVGALYAEIGVLTGVFMLGLALGGSWSARSTSARPLLAAQIGGVAASVLLAIAFLLLDRIAARPGLGAAVHGFLLLAAGAATGSVFPAAARTLLARSTHARAGSVVAAAVELCDHAGAAAAALFGSVLLIPALGLTRSAAVLAIAQGLALIVTAASPPARAAE